jgi:hypothetical protein
MCILSPDQPHASPAARLDGPARQQLARDALAGVPVSQIAADQQVSRPFVYRQRHHAQDALDDAFAPPPADPPGLLFWLPVTKPWLEQLVLGLTLICHSSVRFRPDCTIADFASGLRAGQAEAMPDVPGRGDVFHALQTATPLVGYLNNRAYEAIADRSRLESRQARFEHRPGRKDASLAGQRRYARAAEAKALALADEVAVLISWLRHDVLAVRGPDYASRCQWYDWIVAQLHQREPDCPHRVRPVRVLLENQRDALLAFAKQLDRDLQALAEGLDVPATLVEEVRQVLRLASHRPERWQREQDLWRRWGSRYGVVRAAVEQRLGQVVRASSVIENLNSRLRNYFFLRRHLGADYLTLLQFFLNHRRFVRSEHQERVGKSPRERLTGQRHGHWLTLLGYPPFARN